MSSILWSNAHARLLETALNPGAPGLVKRASALASIENRAGERRQSLSTRGVNLGCRRVRRSRRLSEALCSFAEEDWVRGSFEAVNSLPHILKSQYPAQLICKGTMIEGTFENVCRRAASMPMLGAIAGTIRAAHLASQL